MQSAKIKMYLCMFVCIYGCMYMQEATSYVTHTLCSFISLSYCFCAALSNISPVESYSFKTLVSDRCSVVLTSSSMQHHRVLGFICSFNAVQIERYSTLWPWWIFTVLRERWFNNNQGREPYFALGLTSLVHLNLLP